MIFSLYFQIILSLSLSFLLHAFNFKKHLHSFLTLLTTTDKNNNKLDLKCTNHPFSSKSKPKISLPPPRTIHEMKQLMTCTESINEYQGDEYCLRNTRAVEGGVNSNNTFPPPLSSLDNNCQPSYILLPVRKDGRLQLNKMRVDRPDILYANRQDGRLRLYLVPDECNANDVEQEEYYEDDEEEEEYLEEEEITIVESESEEEIMGEESRCEEDDRAREWSNNKNNERYRRRCHQQLVNYIHGSHNNLVMYGVAT
ncbi:putative The fantastic four family protein [Medicago truncatula]|nr:uncharacterized protein LOC11410744 [Medicago truncatula]RHN80728.1 putative The fantastic four family protein [Medicago truncatula]